ncbi:MAG: ABC transporter substrate-binding protein [Gammaproteobacteria bacterium]|nr:ABC transporter substrate-binding protein [Gammaproteobacteria bacterium]
MLVLVYLGHSLGLAAPNPTAALLTIAVAKTPLSAPWYVAERLGLFKKYQLTTQIVDYPSGKRALQAVLDSQAEVATVADFPIMLQSFNHTNMRVLATFTTSRTELKVVTRQATGMHTPADLVGKRVGVIVGTSSQFFLERVLLYHGIRPQQVGLIHAEPTELPQLLAEGKIDAVAAWEPVIYHCRELLKDGLVEIPSEHHYRESFNLVAPSEFIEHNPATLTLLLRILAEAVEYTHNHPQQAQAILKQRLGLDDEFIRWSWSNYEYKLQLDQELIQTLENEARWALQRGLVNATQIPNYLRFIDNRWIKQLAPTADLLVNPIK